MSNYRKNNQCCGEQIKDAAKHNNKQPAVTVGREIAKYTVV